MIRMKSVSSKTYTQQQLNDYANQHNPNNKAYKARVSNHQKTKKASRKKQAKRQAKRNARLEHDIGDIYSLDWFCYSNPYDFD